MITPDRARPVLVSLAMLVFVTVSSEAKPIGTQTVGAAPYWRSKAIVASGKAGTLAVWVDRRSGWQDELYAAMLDADGAPSRTLRLERAYTYSEISRPSVSLGADDEGFLIIFAGVKHKAWGNVGERRMLRVSADGTASPSVATSVPDTTESALAWNGSAYAAVVRGKSLVLLDRHGTVISGEIRLRLDFTTSEYGSVVSANGRWLVHLSGRLAVVAPEDFPAVGQSKEVDSQPFLENSFKATPARLGYVAAWRSGDSFRIQRLSSLGARFGPVWEHKPTTPDWRIDDLSIATDGDSIIVQYLLLTDPSVLSGRGMLLRLMPDGAVNEIPFTSEALNRGGNVVSTANGVLTSWKAGESLYCKLIGSETWDRGGNLLSASRPAQWLRQLIEGEDSVLAVWIETTAREDTLMVAIVGLDGELHSEPVAITRQTGPYPFVAAPFQALGAFGSSKFLIVYPESTSALLGRFVSVSGAPIGEPFEVSPKEWSPLLAGALRSVTSDGADFFVASITGIRQLKSDGTLVNQSPFVPYELEINDWYEDDGTILAWDGAQFLATYRLHEGAPVGSVALATRYFAMALSQSIHLNGSVEEIFDCYSASEAAVAARNGRALTIFGCWDPSGDVVLWSTVSFTKSGVAARRDLTRSSLPWHVRPSVVPMGAAFLVSIGPTLAVLDENAKVLKTSMIDEDVLESAAVPGENGQVLVLHEHREDVVRLNLKTMKLGSRRRAATSSP